MRAVVLEGTDLHLRELPVPEPGPGQVLAKTLACGICGSDLHLRRHSDEVRKLALDLGADPAALAGGIVMGHEFVAEVAAVGPGANAKPGDRVCSMPFLLQGATPLPIGASPLVAGAFADYLLLTDMLLLKVPDGMPTEAAALTEPFGIAVHAVAKARLEPGDAALVVGCGPIGLAVAAVLRARGVEAVVALDLVEGRLALATQMGATGTAKGAAEGFAALAAAAPGKPVVAFDCTGARGVLGLLIRHAPQNGRIVVAGIAPGEDSILPMLAISKEVAIQFVVYYTPAEFAEALELLASDKLPWRPLLTGTVDLEGLPAMFDELAGRSAHAKVLVMPHGPGAAGPA